MLKQIQTAVAKVAKVTGMTYKYGGTTTFTPRQENLVSSPADIIVAVINPKTTNFSFSENSLGYGGVLWATWYGGDGEGAAVVRGYAVLIPAGMNKLKAGFGGGNTQGNVILHELAHAAGLDHVRSNKQQMYPDLTAKSPNGYASGDLQGLNLVGKKAGCITVRPGSTSPTTAEEVQPDGLQSSGSVPMTIAWGRSGNGYGNGGGCTRGRGSSSPWP